MSASRKDVAKKAGLSESTVSRALSGHPLISLKTKELVKSIAFELGYIPNQQASLLAKKKTCRIGLVVPFYKNIPTFSRSYFPMILDGAVAEADARGFSVTIIPDRIGETEKDLVRMVKSKEVDGILLSILPLNDRRIITLREAGVPFVIINSEEEGVSCINNDPLPGLTRAFEYLKENGHTRVGFVAGDMRYQNAVERHAAFRKLAARFNMQAVLSDGNFSRTSGYYAAGKLLQGAKRPTVLLAASDRAAMGMLEYCRDHGLDVPRDVSILGFDNLDPAPYLHPSLTTIGNPVHEAGSQSAGLLIDIIDGKVKKPKTIRLDTTFVVRNSSGPAPEKN